MTDVVQFSHQDGIADIRIDRPRAMNAIDFDLMDQLSATFREADANPDIRVVIFSGIGDHFGAGYDLKLDWSARYDGRSPVGTRRMLNDCVNFEYSPWDCSKPVIAMVRGYCLAGSCELAMMCCVTFASENAQFGEPEIRFSTAPPALIMPWVVGLKKARELLYTGDLIDAEEAHRIGMINRVYPDDRLEAETWRYARRAASISLEGLQTTKAAINRGAEIAGLRSAIEYGVQTGAILDATETETYRQFNAVRERDGLGAAIRWRESQFE